MNNNAWFKKEKPLLGLTGLGGGVDGLAVVGAAAKTYVDDVFSTYVYKGTGSSLSINSGIDLSTEGGLTWVKNRSTGSTQNSLFDTVRGVDKVLYSNASNAEADYNYNQTFTSTGFTFNNNFGDTNDSSDNYSSWTFRKAPGFFDIVTYTGTGSARTIDHSLGSVPGMIIIKDLTAANEWSVYHRSIGNTKNLRLNNTDATSTSGYFWNDTSPTASVFTVGTGAYVNTNGNSYVAYLFSGGPSANTSYSVEFDGTGDYLSLGPSSDFDFGTGDFTIECWVKKDNTNQGGFFQFSDASGGLDGGSGPAAAWTGSAWQVYAANPALSNSSYPALRAKVWYHIALVRSSSVTTFYVNGENVSSAADTQNYDNSYLAIGGYYNTSFLHDGTISNFRVVKGTAVYTSGFRPQHKVLENITGTVLLCCNDSSTTGSTITPGTITANGDPSVSTDNPDFIDSESFKFGAEEDQNVISCGKYIGDGTAGLEEYLGWEPQYLLIKNATTAGKNWFLFDSMRGIYEGANDHELYPNDSGSEEVVSDRIDLTSTGFKIATTSSNFNTSGDTYVYMVIRRPDGYVGKPPSAGTEVFTTLASSSTNAPPWYKTTDFPVDFAFARNTASTENWSTGSRLTGKSKLSLNLSDSASDNVYIGGWDYQSGWNGYNGSESDYQAWMFKRHAGMDVVNWDGNAVSTGRQIPHSLGTTPEMMWCKMRNHPDSWAVYHSGMNGGTNPQDYMMKINSTDEQANTANFWYDTAPTSTHFTIGADGGINGSTRTYIAYLFSSVTGISKVGYYTGNGSATERTITLGFQPRFIIIRGTNTGASNWLVMDTLRGWAAGNDARIWLDGTWASETNVDFGAPTSTGFTLTTTHNNVNASSGNYIYYAHA